MEYYSGIFLWGNGIVVCVRWCEAMQYATCVGDKNRTMKSKSICQPEQKAEKLSYMQCKQYNTLYC